MADKTEIYANNPSATLSGAMDSSQTTLTVASTANLPSWSSGQQYRILIDNELMIVTNVSGATLTVTRGAEGTAAAAHSASATITVPLTAASLVRSSDRHPAWSNQQCGNVKTAKFEYLSLAANGTQTLLNLASGNAGFITSMWFGVTCNDFMGRERSRLKVYLDGDSSASLDTELTRLHASDYGPPSFATDYIGFQALSGGNNLGYYNYHRIPFKNGIKIDFANGSSTQSATVWGVVSYCLTPAPWDWGRAYRFKNFEQRLTSSDGVTVVRGVSPYSQQDLINISGRGMLWMVYMLMDGGDNNYNYLEGNIKMYIDGDSYPGSPSYQTSGTEDYFFNSNYFGAGQGYIGNWVGTTKKDNSHIVGAYRIHMPDPIIFDSSLRITWNAGDASQATVTNNIYLNSAVYYYLDQ